MYFFENYAQPELVDQRDVLVGMMTLTRVGYGDVYPVTIAGRVTAAIVAFLGFGLFGLPAGIVSAEFIRIITTAPEANICPHCGKAIEN